MTLLCSLDEIPDNASKGFTLAERQLFAVRRNGALYLYENRCPHRGIPLEWQPDTFLDAEQQFIQCATHGALFQIDSGLCIAGPCNGAHLQPVAFELIDQQVVLSEASS